jgi:hypothetical protein
MTRTANLADQLNAQANGLIIDSQGQNDECYNFYDWFCKDTSLCNKTKSLGKKLASIIKSKRLDPTKQYVFFKNNCPGIGSLYDDFRICDIESGDVIYTIIPSSGHNSQKGIAFVYGRENGFKEPFAQGKWSDIKKWFMEK